MSDLTALELETKPQPNVREAVPVRTSEQKLFSDIMSGLDGVKLFSDILAKKGDRELLTRSVRINELEGLSPAARDFFGKTGRLDLSVTFEINSRTLSVSDRKRKIEFILDKGTEKCTVQEGTRKGGVLQKKWEMKETEDIPTTDALVLVQNGF